MSHQTPSQRTPSSQTAPSPQDRTSRSGRRLGPAIAVCAAVASIAALPVPVAAAPTAVVARDPAPTAARLATRDASSATTARVPRIAWSACAEVPGFQCARVPVPLDYDTPRDGRTVTLALVRHPAETPGRRLGTVFFNPGGPGGVGTDDLPAWLTLFPREVRQRFDLVSWDPRGVGRSTASQCFDTDAQGIRFFADVPTPFPVGRAQVRTFLDAYSRFGAVCRARQGELLRHLSTADTARDLDLLRRAVGSPKLNYLGTSYGTFLGATYANLFPSKVRALVLDGNVAPSAWTNSGRRDAGLTSLNYRVGMHLGQAQAFDQFLRLCTSAGTERCAFAAPTVRQTRAKWQQLLVRTRRAPIPLRGRPIDYATLVDAVAGLLFVSRPVQGFAGWPATAQILQTLYEGGSSGTPRPPTYARPEGEAGVLCGDSPSPRRRSAYPAIVAKATAQAGPFGAAIWADTECVNWAQQEDTYRGPWDRWTARPILLIGNTFDPSTPYAGSVKAERELARARLLTVQAWGHTALLNPSCCVSDRVSSYLVRGTLPPIGTVCAQDQLPFDPVPADAP